MISRPPSGSRAANPNSVRLRTTTWAEHGASLLRAWSCGRPTRGGARIRPANRLTWPGGGSPALGTGLSRAPATGSSWAWGAEADYLASDLRIDRTPGTTASDECRGIPAGTQPSAAAGAAGTPQPRYVARPDRRRPRDGRRRRREWAGRPRQAPPLTGPPLSVTFTA